MAVAFRGAPGLRPGAQEGPGPAGGQIPLGPGPWHRRRGRSIAIDPAMLRHVVVRVGIVVAVVVWLSRHL